MTEVISSSLLSSISSKNCLVTSWNFSSAEHDAGQCACLPHWKHQTPPHTQATDTGLFPLATAPDIATLTTRPHFVDGHHLNSGLASRALSIFCDRNLLYQEGTKAKMMTSSTQTSHLYPGHLRLLFPRLICILRWTSQHSLQKTWRQCFSAVNGGCFWFPGKRMKKKLYLVNLMQICVNSTFISSALEHLMSHLTQRLTSFDFLYLKLGNTVFSIEKMIEVKDFFSFQSAHAGKIILINCHIHVHVHVCMSCIHLFCTTNHNIQ